MNEFFIFDRCGAYKDPPLKNIFVLLAPVLMMWLPSIINSDMIFDVRGIPTLLKTTFSSGLHGDGMVYDSGVACYLHRPAQSNRANKQRNFENVVPADQHCKDVPCKVYRFVMLAAVQMVMAIGAYYASAAIATGMQDYNFVLDPLYVCKNVLCIYIAAIPMAAVYWAISTLIKTPIFSVGMGLASIVPSVLMINTKSGLLIR